MLILNHTHYTKYFLEILLSRCRYIIRHISHVVLVSFMITYSSLDIYTIHLLTRANNAISTTNTKSAESLLIDHEIFQLRFSKLFDSPLRRCRQCCLSRPPADTLSLSLASVRAEGRIHVTGSGLVSPRRPMPDSRSPVSTSLPGPGPVYTPGVSPQSQKYISTVCNLK